MSIADRWEGILSHLRGQGRFRELRCPSGIDFASNDYLGYSGGRAVPLPPTTLSTSGAASRLLRGHHPVWEAVEAQLAVWHGAEAALVFTSGYAANEGLLSTVIGPRDWVASDRLNHACIGDGLRLAGVKSFKFRHNDLNHLEEGLKLAAANRRVDQELFVVTESLFSMDGDFPDLPQLCSLAESYGAYVILDEAHATGCYGTRGTGLAEQYGVQTRVLATVHTGGKALGVPGAYVAGSQRLKQMLVNRCRHFLFTTALPPAVGEWWLAMLKRVPGDADGRNLLHLNTHHFRDCLEDREIPQTGGTQVVPIIIGDDVRATTAAGQLQSRGFDVRAVRPPTVPEGTARLRISIHADHSLAQLEALADELREVLR